MNRPRTRALWLLLLLLIGSRAHLAAQVAPRPAGPEPTATVAFLAGCWVGRSGDLEVREQWSDGDAGVMLGTTRYLRDGEVVDWEFARISVVEGTLTLQPWPRGVRSEHGFPLVRAEPEIVFENLEHDFPVRIVYARTGPDEISPRIEGRDGSGPGWTLRRVACPG